MPTISLNLLLDEAAEDVIRALWRDLAASGVPAKGSAGYGPHITLVAYVVTEARIADYAARLPSLTRSQQLLPLRLESLGVFPETGVVYLAPRPTAELLALHQRVVHDLAELDRTSSIDEWLLPGRWTPHCTLAGHLDMSGVTTTVEACLRLWRPVQGHGVAIGLRVHPSPDNYARVNLTPNAS